MDDATPYGLCFHLCSSYGIVHLADICRGEVEMIGVIACIVVSAVVFGVIWAAGMKNEGDDGDDRT